MTLYVCVFRNRIQRADLYWLTSMHTEVTVVLVQRLQGGDVRCSFYYLIHPLDGPYHLVAFFLSEDRRTLVFGNLSFEKSER